MSWEIVLVISFGITVFAQGILKSIVHKLPNARALSLQFFICAMAMIFYGAIWGDIAFKLSLFPILGIGFINAFGAYFQWRAYRYSLSKTSLFLPLSGIIAVSLAAIFLGESNIYNPYIILGSLILFCSAFILNVRSSKEEESTNTKWLLFVLGMVLISGVAVFMLKFFSFTVPKGTFLLYWYSGAFLGSLPILLLEGGDTRKLFQKEVWRVPLASLGIMGALATTYWMFQLSPAGIVVPVYSFSTTLLAILAGWFVFKERKGLSKLQVFGFASGIIGILLIMWHTYF